MTTEAAQPAPTGPAPTGPAISSSSSVQQQSSLPTRPQLTAAARSSSFLREHQQYRPPNTPQNHFGIDTVVEDVPTSRVSSPAKTVSPSPFNGIPSPSNPPKIVESGLNHDFSHPNCAPAPGGRTNRLIATLFYKARSPRVSNAQPSPTLLAQAASSSTSLSAPSASNNATAGSSGGGPASETQSQASDIPPNLAPTTNIDDFPLEPPTADAEPLDHLYGSYVSPLCITSFLHLMSTFPLPPGSDDMTSSHRCLDSSEHPLVVELTLDPAPRADYLSLRELRKHELINRFEREWNVDVALQRDVPWRRHPRLVVFDMDSTLITQEVIDLLAAAMTDRPDVAARVADITHRAMLGELEFEPALRDRVALLAGLPEDIFTRLRPALEPTAGVRPLLRALRRLGVGTAVLSGGFAPLTAWLAAELGIDHAHANEVEVRDGRLTGKVAGAVVGRERKRDLLVDIAARERVDLAQVVAVGDGANDLLMMEAAGLGVAWRAKPRVQMEAGARLNGESLLDLLYLFGFTSEEIEMLTA